MVGQSLKQGGRVVNNHSEAFVAFDTSKLRNAVAIAEGGRHGEVRFFGEIENTEAATTKLVRKLAAKYRELTFCYEAAHSKKAGGSSKDQPARCAQSGQVVAH
jgi:hypothetical protein